MDNFTNRSVVTITTVLRLGKRHNNNVVVVTFNHH